LVVGDDREGELRGPWGIGFGLESGVTTDTDDVLLRALSDGRDEPDTLFEIELREQREVAFAELLLRSEEAEVDRAGAQVLPVIAEPLFVVGADRTDVDRASVMELLLCRIVAEIAHWTALFMVSLRQGRPASRPGSFPRVEPTTLHRRLDSAL